MVKTSCDSCRNEEKGIQERNKKAAAEIHKGTNEAETFVVHVSLHTESTLL